MKQIRCPICGTSLDVSGSADSGALARPLLPFCSVRCQQVDLGRWLAEEYHVPHISDPEDDHEEEDPPQEDPPLSLN